MSSCLQYKWRSSLSTGIYGLFFLGGYFVDESFAGHGDLLLLASLMFLAGPIDDIMRIRKGPSSLIRTLSTEGLDVFVIPAGLLICLPILGLRLKECIDNELYLALLQLCLAVVSLFIVAAIKVYPRLFIVKYRRQRNKLTRLHLIGGVGFLLLGLPCFDCFTGRYVFGDLVWSVGLCTVSYFLVLVWFRIALILYGYLAVEKLSQRSNDSA